MVLLTVEKEALVTTSCPPGTLSCRAVAPLSFYRYYPHEELCFMSWPGVCVCVCVCTRAHMCTRAHTCAHTNTQVTQFMCLALSRFLIKV